MPALTLVPVLGSIQLLSSDNRLQLEPKIVSGATNSTRWIIDIEQPHVPEPVVPVNVDLSAFDGRRNALMALSETLSAEFQLIHGGNPQAVGVFSFSFGAVDSGMYLAKPWLNYDPATRIFTVKAFSGSGAKYRLSLDSLHSMHR